MGAVRRRFSADEKALLVAGLLVEVKHSTVWRRAEVVDGAVHTDSLDLQYVWVVDRDRQTRTAAPGQRCRAYSKGIRALRGV